MCEINSDHCVYGYTFERTANDFIVSAQLSTVVCESQEYILRKNSKGLMLSPRRPISLGSFYDIFFFVWWINYLRQLKLQSSTQFFLFFFNKERNFI